MSIHSFSQLDRAVSSLICWTEAEKVAFFKLLKIEKYKAGEYVSKETTVCDKLIFVNKGLLCNITLDENAEEFVTNFTAENKFITDVVSFVTGSPALSAIKALEDGECVIMPRSAVYWMYDNVKEGNKFGKIQFEYVHIWLIRRQRLNYLKDPEDRYKLMLEMFPGIELRVNQRLLSSFLRIDPAHFTRLGLATIDNTNC